MIEENLNTGKPTSTVLTWQATISFPACQVRQALKKTYFPLKRPSKQLYTTPHVQSISPVYKTNFLSSHLLL